MLPSVAAFDGIPDTVLAGLRERFPAGGFRRETIDRLDAVAPGAPGPLRLPLVQAELARRNEPDLRLALLFTFNGPVPRTEAEQLVGEATVAGLLDASFLRAAGDHVRCPFRIVPMDDLWVVADDVMDEAESVMPPGPSTSVIAGVLPERVDGAVLDIGCGPGSLGLLCARRGAARVVGTDINERALVMARLNARLNAVGAEFHAGSVFDPVRGQRFDLIVSQPPYIAKPEDVGGIQFLHGGARGDTITLEILRNAAGALTPRGELLVLCDLALRKDEHVGDYVAQHLGQSGLDMLVLHSSGLSAQQHAIAYAKHGSFDMGRAYVREVQQYLAHLEREGIAAFRHALFVGRRAAPDARSLWITPVAVREVSAARARARTRLWRSATTPRVSDPDLLRSRLRVAPGAEWISVRRAPEGDQHEHRVRFGPEWPALEQIVTDESLMLCSLIDRHGLVEDAVTGYAELCDATPAEVRTPLLRFIRESLLNGLLVFEENGDAR